MFNLPRASFSYHKALRNMRLNRSPDPPVSTEIRAILWSAARASVARARSGVGAGVVPQEGAVAHRHCKASNLDTRPPQGLGAARAAMPLLCCPGRQYDLAASAVAFHPARHPATARLWIPRGGWSHSGGVPWGVWG
jgi:hypothetical protein